MQSLVMQIGDILFNTFCVLVFTFLKHSLWQVADEQMSQKMVSLPFNPFPPIFRYSVESWLSHSQNKKKLSQYNIYKYNSFVQHS